MTTTSNRGHPRAGTTDGEAQRWLRRAREIGEAAARAEYHQEERRKPRQARGGYAWWRSNVHHPIHHAGDHGRTS